MPIILPVKVMHMLMILALNEKMVASTCVGEIFAIRTKGGMIINPRIRGKSVDDVKKRKVNTLMPRLSYHLSVKAISKKLPIAITSTATKINVLVSVFLRKIE